MRTPHENLAQAPELDRLLELRRTHTSEPTREELDQGLRALRTRLDTGRRHRRLSWWFVPVTASVLSLFVWLVSERSTTRLPELTYEVSGGEVIDGGYLRGAEDRGITLAFNEGTRLVLDPGTRGRLRSVDETGARVGIENGSASFEVTPNSRRRWVVEVGPFLVTVKGTAFQVGWDPASERFELALRHGEVVVSGPMTGGELTLRAGQRMVVSLPKAETLITEDRPERSLEPTDAPSRLDDASPSGSATGVAVVEDPRHAADSAATGTATVRTAPQAPTPGRRWVNELANGQWDRILADVDRASVEATLSTASSEELFAVANAARYRRRSELALRALLAQRERFPGSQRALEAAFLLGRVEESRGGGARRALGWYDEYLKRAPSGAYAAEALGRKMTLVHQASGAGAARPIASDYLLRFPKGSYAGAARALLGER